MFKKPLTTTLASQISAKETIIPFKFDSTYIKPASTDFTGSFNFCLTPSLTTTIATLPATTTSKSAIGNGQTIPTLFGASSGISQPLQSQIAGTSQVKFNPVSDQDTMNRNGELIIITRLS
jgi:hypothetical protein